jgi:hypothetical protein
MIHWCTDACIDRLHQISSSTRRPEISETDANRCVQQGQSDSPKTKEMKRQTIVCSPKGQTANRSSLIFFFR